MLDGGRADEAASESVCCRAGIGHDLRALVAQVRGDQDWSIAERRSLVAAHREQQDRLVTRMHEIPRRAPEHEVVQAAISVGGHRDLVGTDLFRAFENPRDWVPTANDVGRHGQVAEGLPLSLDQCARVLGPIRQRRGGGRRRPRGSTRSRRARRGTVRPRRWSPRRTGVLQSGPVATARTGRSASGFAWRSWRSVRSERARSGPGKQCDKNCPLDGDLRASGDFPPVREMRCAPIWCFQGSLARPASAGGCHRGSRRSHRAGRRHQQWASALPAVAGGLRSHRG